MEWAHGPAARDEFQTNAQLQRIMDKEAAVMKKHSKGKGLIGSAPFEFLETCATGKPFSGTEFKHFSFSSKQFRDAWRPGRLRVRLDLSANRELLGEMLQSCHLAPSFLLRRKLQKRLVS